MVAAAVGSGCAWRDALHQRRHCLALIWCHPHVQHIPAWKEERVGGLMPQSADVFAYSTSAVTASSCAGAIRMSSAYLRCTEPDAEL